MESEARYALVGAVVLALTALLVMSVLWLTRATEEEATAFYQVSFRQFSLAGLQEGSDVTMKGMKVGTVRDLEISSDDIELVKVLVQIKASTPVKTDTEAVVLRNLLTGFAGIDLSHSSQGAPFLERKPGEKYPVIPEGKSTLGAIQEGLPRLMEHASEILTDVDGLLSEENRASVTNILANVSKLTDELASRRKQIVSGVEDLSGLARRATEFLDALDRRTELVAKSVRDTSANVSTEFSALARNVSQAAQAIAATAERYEEPRALITGPAKNTLGPGESKR